MSPKFTCQDGQTPSVCIVGTGPAGLCAAIQLKRQLGVNTFTVYEKAHDIGGAWLANKYPGLHLDIACFAYVFSFEINAGWSKLLPGREEVWRYFQKVAKKYDIYAHTQFNTEVKSIHWNDSTNSWSVTTVHLQTNEERVKTFQIVILGTGPLSQPFYPPEFDAFIGPKMHSAHWDSSIKLENQVVGVVGCGPSAVQVIPAVAPKAKQLIAYIRSPPHLYPKQQLSFSWITKLIFTIFPFLLWISRYFFILTNELALSMYNTGSLVGKAVALTSQIYLYLYVRDKEVRKRLTPRSRLGYKPLPLIFLSFYKAFNRSNVQLNSGRIVKIDGQNVTMDDGTTNRLDVLILCTGFKMQDFFSPIQVVGVNGVDLMKQWQTSRPETFFGITCHEAPNLFFLLGPNALVGSNSSIFMIGCQVAFIINALRELMKRNAASIQVKMSAQTECMLWIDDAAKNKVYMRDDDEGPTFLRNQNGFSTILWPKTCTIYWLRTRRLDALKFEFMGSSLEDNQNNYGQINMAINGKIEDIV